MTSAIADADVVVFGVDRNEPVLNVEQIREGRDWAARPLTIFDFNMYGSTTGMEAAEGVTLHDAQRLEKEVASFADQMCATDRFSQAVDAAETWIIEHTLGSNGRLHDGRQARAARSSLSDRGSLSCRMTAEETICR